MVRRIFEDSIDEVHLEFAFATIEEARGDAQDSGVVLWLGSFFVDGDDSGEMVPEPMADAVLTRYNQRNVQK